MMRGLQHRIQEVGPWILPGVEVLAGLGVAAVGTMLPSVSFGKSRAADTGKCPFRLAVINDEITQDFEKACQIVSQSIWAEWIELRSMWDKNVTELDAKELERCKEDSRRSTSCA